MNRKITVSLVITSVMLLLVLCLVPKAIAGEQCECVIAYLYPTELKRGDVVSDGGHGPSFKIQSDTLFIWVDLMPDADFAHPTKYIFIRDHDKQPVLVFDGEWWPYLNGQPILYGSPNKYCSVSPYQLDQIMVYLYPSELREGDVVSDGPQGPSLKIDCDTLFIWVDLVPTAFFAHATKYVFIRGQLDNPVIVADGEWWPCLNGQRILHGSPNLGALISPFKLSCPRE